MFSNTLSLWGAHHKRKTLASMLKKFKLAGAHPDILAARHPAKAHENGEALILLETLLSERTQPSSVASDKMTKTHDFRFWVKRPGMDDDAVIPVQCKLCPAAGDMSVKQSLASLFEGAGLNDDFELESTAGQGRQEMDFGATLRTATEKARSYHTETGPLFELGQRYVSHLRSFGVVVVFQDSKKNASLLTLPENFEELDPQKALYRGRKTNNPELQKFLVDRGLSLFDFSRVGSHSAVERIVSGLERLVKLFDSHRGTIIRKGICVIISASEPSNEVTPDGCVRLSLHDVSSWDVYLLSLNSSSWGYLVEMQSSWRQSMAPKLQERKRILSRVSDMLGVHTVRVSHAIGHSMKWEEELLLRLKADEVTIRKTIAKYDIKDPQLKSRGTLYFKEKVLSHQDETKEVGYSLDADGSITLSCSLTTPQILKALRTHFPEAARRIAKSSKLNAELERLSARLGVEFHVDGIWKKHMLVVGSDPNEKALRFATTMTKAFAEVRALLLTTNASGWTILISDRFEASSTGILLVPWNAELDTLSRFLIKH